MKLDIATVLPCAPEQAWDAVGRVRVLQYVAAPLVRFEPVEPPSWPEVWNDGRYRVRMKLFGLLPMGRHWIVISHPSPDDASSDTRHVRDNGGGSLIPGWDHLISIGPAGTGSTRYRDTLEVRAGLLTFPVWLFA